LGATPVLGGSSLLRVGSWPTAMIAVAITINKTERSFDIRF